MSKICYLPRSFPAEKMALIHVVNQIIADYQAQGHSLTVRQVYYKLVTRNLIANQPREYDRLSDLLNDARLAGLVDWEAIIDRTRKVVRNDHWDHPMDIVRSASDVFAFDKWEGQPHYVEVWVEKDALKGIVGHACQDLDVPYFSCRGYTSVTEMHAAAMRLQVQHAKGRKVRILHLGDHDPSGLDMTRDIRYRIGEVFRVPVRVERIALNRDQIDHYQPPPNPAKVTDSRAAAYIEEHGESSWELDALEPDVLIDLIQANVLKYRDEQRWQAQCAKEGRARRVLEQIAFRWNEVLQLLRTKP